MIVVLFDQSTESSYSPCFNRLGNLFNSDSLWPFTCVKSTALLRVGILSIFEKWKLLVDAIILYDSYDNPLTIDDQIALFSNNDSLYFVSSNIIPNATFIEALKSLSEGQCLQSGDDLLAVRAELNFSTEGEQVRVPFEGKISRIQFIEDLYLNIGNEIIEDFATLTKERHSASYSTTNTILGDQLFICDAVEMECATLNTLTGPIYIDEGAVVMEGANLRGPLYIGKNAVVKMGTTIYSNVSLGEGTVVGGEIGNSSIGDFSAKGHYGYLGCSVIGDWCNLGAGTTNSNLKNNLSAVKLFDYKQYELRDTGLMKCGLFMGDFSRSGIQSAFNTGTVIGMACMLSETEFYPKFVPSFSWLYGGKQEAYELQKFVSDLEVVFLSKNKKLHQNLIQRIIEINQSTF
ncbi:hypothetical protein LZQ00_02690 [Sphingobacterium sp. SRCM116780]|uniref:putative sugar nucleotidyl transferase n=1 Tax=Sphingobacterium sp. SRCM116780 TaxID=2907623 RepID=UPI001F25197A|nr:putative sugar nucleotidyl transferase [Sphingobacterium sp. SRCM116780]UIR56732.1 hypothetical protein LZQ00_02690 [Sphingobacterium sp. SRCM116780]